MYDIEIFANILLYERQGNSNLMCSNPPSEVALVGSQSQFVRSSHLTEPPSA